MRQASTSSRDSIVAGADHRFHRIEINFGEGKVNRVAMLCLRVGAIVL